MQSWYKRFTPILTSHNDVGTITFYTEEAGLTFTASNKGYLIF